MILWARSLLAVAGLMGMGGVIVAAAGSHAGGGDFAGLAAEFLLIHATSVFGLGAAALAGIRRQFIWLSAGTALAVGTILFGADLSLIAFAGVRPLPAAAPSGGFLMIAGWLTVAVGGMLTSRPRDPEM